MPHCRRHWGSPGKYYFSSLTIFMSFAKRCFISNLDTGNIIPGHGGLLDRIDGMIFAYPFSYLMFKMNIFQLWAPLVMENLL